MFFMSFLKEYFTCKTFGMDTVWTWKSNHKNNWIIYTNNKLWRELTVHFKKKNEIYLPLEIGRQFLLMYCMSFCIWLFDLGKIWYLYCLRVVEHLQHFRPAQKKNFRAQFFWTEMLRSAGVLLSQPKKTLSLHFFHALPQLFRSATFKMLKVCKERKRDKERKQKNL